MTCCRQFFIILISLVISDKRRYCRKLSSGDLFPSAFTQIEVMGVVELQPEEISRRARLPQQAELEVRGRRELMTAAEIKPVLVEIAFAAVEVDEVGTGLYGLVVKRYRDLQPIAAPVGVTVTVIFLEPALLESKPMLEFCPRPSLLQGKLLIEPILLS